MGRCALREIGENVAWLPGVNPGKEKFFVSVWARDGARQCRGGPGAVLEPYGRNFLRSPKADDIRLAPRKEYV